MFKGRVDLTAPVVNGTITFAQTEFDASWLPSARLRLSCSDAAVIVGTVWITGVQSSDAVIREAQTFFEGVLSRLTYSLEIAIGLSKVTSSEVEPETPLPGHTLNAGTSSHYLTGLPPKLLRSISPQEVQQTLDVRSLPGERSYNDFRSARLSTGGVEEFMHLYRLLLELCGDSQASVDRFIQKVEPLVATTPSPKYSSQLETLYTRLRNELAHKRSSADIEATKQAMLAHVALLRKIVRQAIVEFA